MNYLSDQSYLSITPYLLFVQPYHEARTNIAMAFHAKEMDKTQRAKHLLVGMVLSVPLINTVALLILRALRGPSAHSLALLLEDKPFSFWPFDRPMPRLLTQEVSYSVPIDELTKLFLDHLYDTHIRGQDKQTFSLEEGTSGSLIVKYQDCVIELSEILEHIDWSNLGEKWQTSQEELKAYLKRSLVCETLKTEVNSPFESSNPFIWLYTSYGFYSWLNPLLRKGCLTKGLLPYATSDINKQFEEMNPAVVNRIAQEILFISLATAASVNALPEKYKATCRVIRMSYIPKNILKMIQNEQYMVDRGFLSASGPGGSFAGGGPCNDDSYRTKFVIQSKNGRYVEKFSKLPENEVLFRPFTKFKILKCSGDEKVGFRVELEEV